MKSNRPIDTSFKGYAFSVILGILISFSCSTTKNLPKGESLYIGIGKTKIINRDGSKNGENAIKAIENTIQVPPNNSIFGSARQRFPLPFGLWIYNALVNDTTFTSRRLFKMFASEPVLLSIVNPPTRSMVARNILREHGYFRAEVGDSVAYIGDGQKKSKVYYTVDMGIPFVYDSITYLPARVFADSTSFDHSWESNLQPGKQFNLEQITEDRTQVVQKLRNQGYYYYYPDLISYQIDTLQHTGKIQMRIVEKKDLPERVYQPWRIGTASINIHNSEDADLLRDSLWIDDVLIRYNAPLKVRQNVLKRRLRIFPSDYYSQTKEVSQSENLSRLGVFSYVDTRFRAIDTVNNLLDMQIYAVMDKPWDVSLEGRFTTKSNNYVGPGVHFSLSRHNLFGGGEQLSGNVWGSYEFLTNAPKHLQGSDLNSYEIGADINLSSSSILLPKIYNETFDFSPSTTHSLSASMLNRAFFFRMYSVGFATNYSFRRWQHHHQIFPLRVQYNALSRESSAFRAIIADNPILGLSLRNQLVPQMTYTYTFDNVFVRKGSHHFWFEGSLSQAGNIINSIYSLAGARWADTKTVLGVPYAQFVKATTEWRYTYAINRERSLAMRLSLGGIWSYGNMKVAPYAEQFYVGGANSIRAFALRTLGPGRYVPSENKYAFLDQSGEFKIESNIEYRLRLTGNLFGALFLDSGNVWLWEKDPQRPGGSLQEVVSASDFLKQMALATGLGLRYDLGLIVVRFDVGFGLHLPYASDAPGYFNTTTNFTKHIGYHLAIGYPF